MIYTILLVWSGGQATEDESLANYVIESESYDRIGFEMLIETLRAFWRHSTP